MTAPDAVAGAIAGATAGATAGAAVAGGSSNTDLLIVRVLIAEFRGEVNVNMAEIKGTLGTALAEIKRHDGEIESIKADVAQNTKDIVELKTVRDSDEKHGDSHLSATQTLWMAIGGIAAMVAVVTTIIIALIQR